MGIGTSASSVQHWDRCTEESMRQPYKDTCQDLPEAGGSATVHFLPTRVSFPGGAKEFQGSGLADIWTPAGEPTPRLGMRGRWERGCLRLPQASAGDTMAVVEITAVSPPAPARAVARGTRAAATQA